MNDLTRGEILDMLEELADRGGPEFAALVKELEKRNHMAHMLNIHRMIEAENEQHYYLWKGQNCQ